MYRHRGEGNESLKHEAARFGITGSILMIKLKVHIITSFLKHGIIYSKCRLGVIKNLWKIEKNLVSLLMYDRGVKIGKRSIFHFTMGVRLIYKLAMFCVLDMKYFT